MGKRRDASSKRAALEVRLMPDEPVRRRRWAEKGEDDDAREWRAVLRSRRAAASRTSANKASAEKTERSEERRVG